MNIKSVLCLLFVWPLLVCHGSSVRLLNGESYDAKVVAENGGIAVTRDNSFGNRLDINNILEVVFTGKPAGPSPATCPPGVLLVNGTFVAGDLKPLTSLADPTVKVGKAGTLVPTASIARVICNAMPAEKVLESVNGRTGVILPTGDFFVGSYDGIKENKIAINSDLFGPQRFASAQVAAVVLRDVQSVPARYEIIAKGGSRYLCDDPRFEGDGVSIRDSILGPVRLAKDDLGAFRAGNGRYQNLVKAKPARVDAQGDTSEAVRFVPGAPTEADQTQAILTTANTSVTYNIPPGFTLFACRISVPKEVAPTMRFSFAVYVDGRLISRSPLIGSADVPQILRVNLGTGRGVSLRVEPSGPIVGVPSGKWIEPMLLRP